MSPDNVVAMLTLLTGRPNLAFQVTRGDTTWRAAAIGYGEGSGPTVEEACANFAAQVLAGYSRQLDRDAADVAQRQAIYQQASALAVTAGVPVPAPKVA